MLKWIHSEEPPQIAPRRIVEYGGDAVRCSASDSLEGGAQRRPLGSTGAYERKGRSPVRTWIMVAGLIGGFYAPTVVAGGYVTARLSRAGFVGLSDFIGGKIEAVFFRRRRRGTLSASNVRSPVRAAELTKGAPTMAPSPMSPEDAAKVADLLKSPLRSSSLEDLAAKLVDVRAGDQHYRGDRRGGTIG